MLALLFSLGKSPTVCTGGKQVMEEGNGGRLTKVHLAIKQELL